MMKVLPRSMYSIVELFLLLTIYGCQKKSEPIGFAKYDPLVWLARVAYEDQDFETSLLLYQKAFEVIPDESANDIFHAAAAALELGKDDVANDLIRTGFSKTNASKNYFDTFSGFTQFRSKEFFVEIENDYEQLVDQFYSNLSYPKEIEDEILEMIKKDQEVRRSSDFDRMGSVDSLNINRLIEITGKYGWIKRGWILLWHQRGVHREDNYVWNHFRPLIESEIKAGLIRKDFWALFDDELSIRNSKQQIYGMYQNQFPIKDIKNVDKRRKEIGLPPLWYLSRITNQGLPTGYSTAIKDFSSFKKWCSI